MALGQRRRVTGGRRTSCFKLCQGLKHSLEASFLDLAC